jgi:Bacterial SH3 domain
MRALLFLSLVGATIYGFLVISGGNTKESQTVQTQPNHSVDERLSSWGSYLAPSPSQNPQLATSQRPAQTPPQLGDDASQNSELKSGTEYQLAASENKTPAVGAEPETVEWAKVILAAQMHSEASVSSPTVRFYSPGSELQVVKREGAWFEVLDPVTQERGWVLDQYLSSIASSTPTQVATESTTEPQSAKPAPPKANKLHHRSAKLAVRGRVAVANADHPFGNWAQGR